MEITLLNEKSTIAQLVGEDVNASITQFIENEMASDEYNFIVTADNLKFAKDKMAELNKSINTIDSFRKDKVNSESTAIDLFKSHVKNYVEMINKKREELKQAVDKFEIETKISITKELSMYVDELLKKYDIRQAFNDVNISDLVVLGAVTAKGALTKKSRESVEGRVMACKSKQDKYDMRLMQLENLSYKAGLESPLTLTHVQGIVYLDSDAEYSDGIEKLLESELERQNIIKEKIKKQADADAIHDAKLQLQKEQNEIRDVFILADHISLNDINYVQYKLQEFENYDFSIFGGNDSFAKDIAKQQIDYLKKCELHILEKFKKDEERKNAVIDPEKEKEAHRASVNIGAVPDALKDIPIVIETVPVEDGKKVVFIDVHLQFKVKQIIGNEKIVAKVNQMLAAAGFSESLIDVEVVS